MEKLCENMITQQSGEMFQGLRWTRFYVKIYASFLKDAMNSQRQAAKRSQQLELHKLTAFNKKALGRSPIEVHDAHITFHRIIRVPVDQRLAKFYEKNLAKGYRYASWIQSVLSGS